MQQLQKGKGKAIGHNAGACESNHQRPPGVHGHKQCETWARKEEISVKAVLLDVCCSNFKISEFFKAKSDMPVVACKTIWKLKQEGVAVKYVRWDNAGENKAFAKLANGSKWNLQLQSEFTGAMTPQRNNFVEIGFSTYGDDCRQCLAQCTYLRMKNTGWCAREFITLRFWMD
jgi:hypothetical protein